LNIYQARKNAEAWNTFFTQIKEKKEGKLPKWFKPRPPGYWKDKNGKYKLMIIIRNDRYEVNESERTIYLKDFKLSLKFKGELKWRGKQGRLEIIYDDARRGWYAHIPVEVENEAKVEGRLRASVDLGIVNLATVYVENGETCCAPVFNTCLYFSYTSFSVLAKSTLSPFLNCCILSQFTSFQHLAVITPSSFSLSCSSLPTTSSTTLVLFIPHPL
jgi:hypothetical protein